MENVVSNTGEPLANVGGAVVESGRNLVNHSKLLTKFGENEFKKLVIPAQNKWLAIRNKPTTRPKIAFNGVIASGGAIAVALFTTYSEFPWKVQTICYTIFISILMLSDPYNICSRFLAKISRCMIVISNTLFIMCILLQKDSMWLVWLIELFMTIVFIFFLNDKWIRMENWQMSKEVESALHGDKDNRCEKNWRANGKRSARTILYNLGYTISDSDLDSIMKAVYSVGFWECQKLYSLENEKLNANVIRLENMISELQSKERDMQEVTENLNNAMRQRDFYHNATNRLVRDIRIMVPEYVPFTDKEKNIVYSGPITNIKNEPKAISEERSKVDCSNQESKTIPKELDGIVQMLPPNVTIEQYYQIIELNQNGNSQRSIEKITGIKRPKIKVCIDLSKLMN